MLGFEARIMSVISSALSDGREQLRSSHESLSRKFDQSLNDFRIELERNRQGIESLPWMQINLR